MSNSTVPVSSVVASATIEATLPASMCRCCLKSSPTSSTPFVVDVLVVAGRVTTVIH
jgi:hypothetical protein